MGSQGASRLILEGATSQVIWWETGAPGACSRARPGRGTSRSVRIQEGLKAWGCGLRAGTEMLQAAKTLPGAQRQGHRPGEWSAGVFSTSRTALPRLRRGRPPVAPAQPHLSCGGVPSSPGASSPELQASLWSLPPEGPGSSSDASSLAPHGGDVHGNMPRVRSAGRLGPALREPQASPPRRGPGRLPATWRALPPASRGRPLATGVCAPRPAPRGRREPEQVPPLLGTRGCVDTLTPEASLEGFRFLFIALDTVSIARSSTQTFAAPAGVQPRGPTCAQAALTKSL